MRQCPTCRQRYPDDLAVCLEDGSSLPPVREIATQFTCPRPTIGTDWSGRISYVVLILLLFLGGGFMIAAGTAGFFIFLVKSEERVFIEPTESPSPMSAASPNPIPISGKPDHTHPVPKQISGGVLNNKAITLPKPDYPPAARAVRASGSVSVQVVVNEEGNVILASAVTGHPLLRAAAVKAARAAKFEPRLMSGQPIKVSGSLTYDFPP